MNKDHVLKLLDYLFVLRPTLFFPAWTFALVGSYAAMRFSGSWQPLGLFNGLMIYSLYTLTVGAVYLINNIIDRHNDETNNKVFLISESYIPPRRALVYLYLILIFTTIVALLYSIDLFWWFTGIFLFWGVVYSVPPFSLKDRPIGGVLTSVISGFGLFGFGWFLYAPHGGFQVWWYSLPYVIAWVSISMLTTIPDSHGDSQDEKETIAVALGHSKTQDYASLLLLISIVLAGFTRDWVIGISSLLAVPFYYQMWRGRSVAQTLKAIRWGVSFLSFAMFFIFPLYFIACFIVFFLSRWYFRNRFDIDYPTWSTKPSTDS